MNDREPGSLAGRTALVTGGSRGASAATSKLLAARGTNVIVNYFNNKGAADKEIKKDADTSGGHAIAIQADALPE
jgi:NAD(P)-dependent dehydrogenase (short-subunit alcohol dehydrogenase family)